jgi:hypothetical protein
VTVRRLPVPLEIALSILLGGAIVVLVTFFLADPDFRGWAFARHQNTASWIARPLLLLPLCASAWLRSPSGLLATILALLSSMFWFPVPETPRDDVIRFLTMERAFLSQGWTLDALVGATAVVAYGVALVAAFWKRSWRLGLIVAGVGAVLKVLWSFLHSPDAGGVILPFAGLGLVALVLAVWVWRARL